MEMTPSHEQETASDLLGRLLAFFEALRRAGLTVTPGGMIDALRSVRLVGIMNRDNFRLALRTNLATSRDEEAIFDRVFEAFWAMATSEVQKNELKLEPREDDRNRELAEGPQDLRGSRLQ